MSCPVPFKPADVLKITGQKETAKSVFKKLIEIVPGGVPGKMADQKD